MRDNSRAVAAAVVGAIVGGVAGYMLFTEQGRRWRHQLEPALDDLSRELSHFRGTFAKAAVVASEGWKLLNDAFAESGTPPPHYPHQTSPF